MARCEDFPCCGHESGCCPDFDGAGRQLNMKCVCGATVPLGSRTSLCNSCLNGPDDDDYREDWDEEDDWDDRDEMDGDHESGLASAGFGTDEDYGSYGYEDSWLDGSFED